MTFTVLRHAALSSLALAIAAPSTAQTITANSASSASNAVIVTATRTPQLARDVISDTVIIGAEEIGRSGAGSITDLLQRQRGIEIARNGGPGTNSSVFIRGANSNQSLVLVDGVRIGSSTSGAANWSAIPLQAIERIEIVYGPLSTLYGADAIAGVIQIFTRKGAGTPSVSAFAGAGSDATREFDASVFGATGGEHSFSYALSAGKEKSDGFSSTKPASSSFNADDDGYDRENAAGQFAFQLAKGHEAGLLFLHSRLYSQFDSGKSAYNTHSDQKLQNIGAYLRSQILPHWHSNLQIGESRDEAISDPGTASGYSQINSKQTDINWQHDFRIGEDTLQLLFGHRKEEVLSSSTPQLGKDRTTKSVAAAYSLKRGAHLVSISARNDDSSQYGSKATGAAGYGYRIGSALRVNASVGTSFRAPTFNELYYPGYGVPDNKPEKGRNAEAGLHYDDGAMQWGAVYYRNRLEDMLVNTTPCPIKDPKTYAFGCAYNVNQATLEGLSLSASRKLGALLVSASADWQDPKDETTGKSLARRSKRHGNVALEYALGKLTAGAELQVSGPRFDDAANRNRLGGYGLLNLVASYQFAPEWSALLRWNNVADKNYEVARNYATSGSTVFAGLRYGIR